MERVLSIDREILSRMSTKRRYYLLLWFASWGHGAVFLEWSFPELCSQKGIWWNRIKEAYPEMEDAFDRSVDAIEDYPSHTKQRYKIGFTPKYVYHLLINAVGNGNDFVRDFFRWYLKDPEHDGRPCWSRVVSMTPKAKNGLRRSVGSLLTTANCEEITSAIEKMAKYLEQSCLERKLQFDCAKSLQAEDCDHNGFQPLSRKCLASVSPDTSIPSREFEAQPEPKTAKRLTANLECIKQPAKCIITKKLGKRKRSLTGGANHRQPGSPVHNNHIPRDMEGSICSTPPRDSSPRISQASTIAPSVSVQKIQDENQIKSYASILKAMEADGGSATGFTDDDVDNYFITVEVIPDSEDEALAFIPSPAASRVPLESQIPPPMRNTSGPTNHNHSLLIEDELAIDGGNELLEQYLSYKNDTTQSHQETYLDKVAGEMSSCHAESLATQKPVPFSYQDQSSSQQSFHSASEMRTLRGSAKSFSNSLEKEPVDPAFEHPDSSSSETARDPRKAATDRAPYVGKEVNSNKNPVLNTRPNRGPLLLSEPPSLLPTVSKTCLGEKIKHAKVSFSCTCTSKEKEEQQWLR